MLALPPRGRSELSPYPCSLRYRNRQSSLFRFGGWASDNWVKSAEVLAHAPGPDDSSLTEVPPRLAARRMPSCFRETRRLCLVHSPPLGLNVCTPPLKGTDPAWKPKSACAARYAESASARSLPQILSAGKHNLDSLPWLTRFSRCRLPGMSDPGSYRSARESPGIALGTAGCPCATLPRAVRGTDGSVTHLSRNSSLWESVCGMCECHLHRTLIALEPSLLAVSDPCCYNARQQMGRWANV